MALLFADIETRETLRRMKEAEFVFGNHNDDKNALFGASDTAVLTEYVMRLQEKEGKRKAWKRSSPQLKYRKHLLNLVMKICMLEHLSFQTCYMSIYLLDRFMDGHDIAEYQLPVVAIVCIVLSGKLLEVDRGIPKYQKLRHYLHDGMKGRNETLVPLERYMFKTFNHDLLVPTEVSFLEVFLLYAVDGLKAAEHADTNNNTDDNNANNNNVLMQNANYPEQHQVVEVDLYAPGNLAGHETLSSIRETALELLQELFLAGPENGFSPSLVAATILQAARREHFLNFWTPNLRTITTFSLEEVQGCLANYLEPKIGRICLKQPHTPPTFLNFILQPCIEDCVVDDDEEEMN